MNKSSGGLHYRTSLRKSSKVPHFIRRFFTRSILTYKLLNSLSKMAQSQVELESLTTELTAGAFDAFTKDISSMLDTAVGVEQLDIAAGTTKQLKNTYKKLTAVCSVKAEGALKGRFQVIFGTEGLFTLAGKFAKQSKQTIMKNRRTGTKTKANKLADAVAEATNLMVAAWDRVFLEEMPGHKHFVLGDTFIGNPWVKSKENIGLDSETELVIITLEMTIEPLPAFKCGVIYPKSMFEPSTDNTTTSAESAEHAADAESGQDAEPPAEKTPAEEVPAQDATEEPAGDDQTDTDNGKPKAAAEASAEDKSNLEVSAAEDTTASEPVAEESSSEQSGADQPATDASETEQSQSGPETSAEETDQPPEAQEVSPQQEPASEDQTNTFEEQNEQKEASEPQQQECQGGPVTDAIARMTGSEALLPGQCADCSAILTGLTAKNVMTTDIVWAAPDETVEQLFDKMQQNDTAYLLIGENRHLEGIVSRSDIRGAMSPYLQSMFSKWRTSMDIATLQIKAQWIMSRPVRTVRPDAKLSSVMQVMNEHGGRCMPVSDEEGKVYGIITVFDIFAALLTCDCSTSTSTGTSGSSPKN